MEKSGILGQERGQRPFILTLWSESMLELQAALPLYLKSHSYGEYIFDWSWANASERAGVAYYPKLVSYTPFTPSSCAKILLSKGLDENQREDLSLELIHQALELQRHLGASSLHFLFTSSWEQELLKRAGLLNRASFQYHWRNENYADFADFLSRLKARKSKAIRKERRALADLHFSWKSGKELTLTDAKLFYQGYLNTISAKGALAYLTEQFFGEAFTQMGENVQVAFAHSADKLLAMSLFFKSEKALFGRYWAPLISREYLHFELCYYQGIEYAIRHNLARFEAGAQGEHKIARGFLPTLIHSSHHIEHPGLERAVADFVVHEAREVEETIKYLMSASPFKERNSDE